jgi:hypothetical protein
MAAIESGGVGIYRQECDEVAANGYERFRLQIPISATV